MKVILSAEVENLGNAGDVIGVKPGYARNFLFPRGLAVRADERNTRQLQHDQRVMESRRRRLVAAADAARKTLDRVGRVVVVRACGADGKLFGAVTSRDIVAALAERAVEVDKRHLQLEDNLKALGDFEVVIKFGQGLSTKLTVSVEPDAASAELIAKAKSATAMATANRAEAKA